MSVRWAIIEVIIAERDIVAITKHWAYLIRGNILHGRKDGEAYGTPEGVYNRLNYFRIGATRKEMDFLLASYNRAYDKAVENKLASVASREQEALVEQAKYWNMDENERLAYDYRQLKKRVAELEEKVG